MAICRWCNNDMLDVTTCSGNKTVSFPGDKKLKSIPYDGPHNVCRDCRVRLGKPHHPGCCIERCPKCKGQLISCGCLEDPTVGFSPDMNGGDVVRGHTLGLHTKSERDFAVASASEVVGELERDGTREDIAYTVGYLRSIYDLAKHEGARDLMDEIQRLLRKVDRDYAFEKQRVVDE